MFEIGRLCVKIAGRDAGKKCVVIGNIDNNYVNIDGETRRKKCNIDHLEPLAQKLEIKKDASHDDIKKAFEELGLKARETKPKKAAPKPKAKRKTPEQLRAQKEEKKKTKEVLKKKLDEKKPAEKEEGKLEAKLDDIKTEEKPESKEQK